MTKRTEHLRRAARRAAPRALAVLLAMCGLGGVGSVLLQTVNTVRVTDSEGGSRLVMTAVRDPQALAALAGLTLETNDSAVYTHGDGAGTLAVTRAFPVAVMADGQEYVIEISAGTAADAVARAGVALEPQDFTDPALDTPLDGQTDTVTVHRVTFEDTVTYEPVPFETEYIEQIDDPDGAYTHHVLRQEGAEGVQQVTTRATYIDGVYSGTAVAATEIITPPVNEVYLTLQNNVVSPLEAPEGFTVQGGTVYGADGQPLAPTYTMRATGYYSARGKGASGLGLYYGTFAVDPTLIPYGTKVFIVSSNYENDGFVYGWAIATDTGAFIHTNRMQVDLFYETYAESAANGVKEVYVYVP